MGSQDLPKRPRVIPAYPQPSMKIPVRSCPKCGGQAIVLPEGLLECFNCKTVWQSAGINYKILRKR